MILLDFKLLIIDLCTFFSCILYSWNLLSQSSLTLHFHQSTTAVWEIKSQVKELKKKKVSPTMKLMNSKYVNYELHVHCFLAPLLPNTFT